ncbi:Short chain dehydrogenase [Aspergillus sclerotialis]|uniref:Short chain dehydrogenase n=1 Tax=Aspergillus sclerotialis TaxID=2070753 RepID=A0A3A2ZRW9_9EURO|nr:Short chain dehydrogenase [Aspergillus sclerotialis]
MESIAVVTGGAGGIGLAIAGKLAQSHEAVYIADLHPERLSRSQEYKSLVSEGRIRAYHCDVTQSGDVMQMASFISSKGKIRTLINNAGATDCGSLQELTSESWRREISLNLDAAFVCFHAFAEKLKLNRGVVVNITSVNGFSVYGNPAYSAAKAGLIHFTKSIAVEYGKFGVRANSVAPGTVRTSIWNVKIQENPKLFDDILQFYPLGRIVNPQDVADAVMFLVSDQAAAITGVCLPVDCGLTAGQAPMARTLTQSDSY